MYSHLGFFHEGMTFGIGWKVTDIYIYISIIDSMQTDLDDLVLVVATQFVLK